MPRVTRWVPVAFTLSLQWCTSPLGAQWQSNTGPAGAVLGATVGGDVERYVRALAMAGIIRPVAWGARGLGPDALSELVRDSARSEHPWRARLTESVSKRAALGAAAFTSSNSGFSWGANDGAMWQGRGFNAAVGVAASLRVWRLSAVAAPLAFTAQNLAFPTLVPVVASASPYSDALFPTIVDLPQRMGGSTYSRLDPGESTVRLHLPLLDVGISTASIGWGTGEAFPAIFGANAGGFPRMLLETSGQGLRMPVLGRVRAQYILGRLDQSAWSNVRGSATYIDRDQSGTSRIGVGLDLSFSPQVLPNLELGASRFYHSPYRNGARRWDAWSKPFEGIFKKGFGDRSGGPGDDGGDIDNQIASFYVRWAFPSRGAEANFELLREDHNWDSRDFAQEPENNSAVLASVRAITHRGADNLSYLTFEYFDGDIRPIAQARAQGYLYSHGYLRQGHTQRGQLLGSPIGSGAIAGERVAWERFTSTGSLRANLQRWRTRALFTDNPEALFLGATAEIPNNHDWIIDGSLASTRYRGTRALTIEGGVAWAGVFNFSDARANLYARASWSMF